MKAPPATEAVSAGSSIFDVPVNDFQSGITITDGAITGTLTKTSAFTNPWGVGYFIALKWPDADLTDTDVKVGVEPTAGSGPASLDPDKDALLKLSYFDDDDKPTQEVVVRAYSKADPAFFKEQRFDLSGLTLSEG